MAAPERFADSQIPLAPRAPSIHDPLLRRRSSLLALRYSYSIGSSALSRIDVGTSRPSALAVVILSTVSYFTDNCTGRSAGFSLLRMRST